MRLRRNEAANYLREKHGIPCSKGNLAKRAVVGGGPTYCLVGRYPMYSEDDLDAWAKTQISPLYNSTSEYIKRERHFANGGASTSARAA